VESFFFTSIMLVIIMSLYPNSIARDMLYISYLLLLDLFFSQKNATSSILNFLFCLESGTGRWKTAALMM